MRLKRFFQLFLAFLMIFGGESYTQDGGGNDKPKVPVSSRLQRKKERKKWKEERKQERLKKKSVKKHHKRLQTKKTNKRMKRNKRKANRTNANKPEFFLKRWFKKKNG